MVTRMELVKYPLVIEPAAQVLEVQVAAHLDCEKQDRDFSSKTYWCPFQRLPQRWNYPLSVDSGTPHLFGNSRHLGRCHIVLGYNAEGTITAIFRRQGAEWLQETLPEEQTGAAVVRPSVRIAFGTEDERQAFVDLLGMIAGAKASAGNPQAETPPGARQLAKRALRNIRLVNVAQMPAMAPERTS